MPEERPYCQITHTHISAEACRASQGQESCLGCGAPTRLCESCHRATVAFPTAGLCKDCCTKQLQEEEQKPFQGVACRHCRDRPIRFWRYGLCLKCAIKADQEGQTPAQEPTTNQEKGGTTMDKAMKESEALCIECKKRPIFIKKHGLCKTCIWRIYTAQREKKKKEKQAGVQETKQGAPIKKKQTLEISPEETSRARDLILKKGQASIALLQKQLHWSFPKAQLIMSALEKAGVVGPGKHFHKREVRGQRQTKASTALPRKITPASPKKAPRRTKKRVVKPSSSAITQRIAYIQEVIKLVGEDSRLGQELKKILADLQIFQKMKQFFLTIE